MFYYSTNKRYISITTSIIQCKLLAKSYSTTTANLYESCIQVFSQKVAKINKFDKS